MPNLTPFLYGYPISSQYNSSKMNRLVSFMGLIMTYAEFLEWDRA